MHVVVWTGSPCPHKFDAVACPVCRGDGNSGRPEALAPAEAVAETFEKLRDAGATQLTLTDGDLLLRREALELLQHAKTLGFSQITLHSQGPVLAQPGVAQAALRAGADRMATALYGNTSQAHDYIAGIPGHFQRSLLGFKRAHAAGAQTLLLAPILRPTYRNLPQLIQKSIPLGISGVVCSAPLGQDRAPHPLTVPLPLVSLALHAAVQVAQAGRLQVRVVDVPLCILPLDGPVLDHDDRADAVKSREEQYAFGKPCLTCPARPTCRGLGLQAVQRHGWVGIEPAIPK